jgi:hypothetical protein
MTIEELQAKPHGELCTLLDELAPQVLNARAHYEALIKQQRQAIAARDLNQAGLRIGEKVRLIGRFRRQTNPYALVSEPSSGFMFQVLNTEGEPVGQPQPEYMFGGFEKI